MSISSIGNSGQYFPTFEQNARSIVESPSLIQKMSDNFYISKRGELTYALTRLTDENLPIWWRLHGTVGGNRGSNVAYELWDSSCEGWTVDQKRFFTMGIEGGAMAFRHSLEMYEQTRGKVNAPAIWIAYIVSGADRDPLKPIEEELFPHVEISLTALTHPDIPLVAHMGIGRNVYQTKRANNNPQLSKHKGLSLSLHAFTARVILETTAEGVKKIWMRTCPTFDMASILDRSLPDSLVLKKWQNMPEMKEADDSIIIRNPEGEVVCRLKKDEDKAKIIFMRHYDIVAQPLDQYAIKYQELADLF